MKEENGETQNNGVANGYQAAAETGMSNTTAIYLFLVISIFYSFIFSCFVLLFRDILAYPHCSEARAHPPSGCICI